MNARYLARRLVSALGMLAFVLVFNFFLFRIVDSDPLAKYRGRVLTAEKRQEIIAKFGLDGSKWEQFVRYIKQTVQLDFGYSTDSGQRVWSVIKQLLPNTLWLVGLSTVITVALGLWLGAKAGWRRGSRFDKVSTGSSMVLYAMPEFWLGMLLLVFLGARTGWFPTGGVRDLTRNLSGLPALMDRLRHLFLPVLTLVLAYLGSYSLIMRSSILETVREDYLTVARAKGLRDHEVLRHHAVPNALLPSVSLIAIGFGYVVGGAITTETVFSYPGLGLATSDAIKNNDLAMLQALFFLSSAALIVANLVADLLYGYLDPRIRRESQ
jgi:peptide/nickel transport system permease protein